MNAEPAEGLRLPLAHRAVDPGKAGQFRIAAQHQIGERAARKVGGGNAKADIAAGPADAGRAVEAGRRTPVARHAEHAAPGMVDLQ
ncbi:hypothetical protein D9M69_701810 [compost metagenome]